MTQEHPITPPPELVEQWFDEANTEETMADVKEAFATRAAQWGADQELEACCEWLQDPDLNVDTYKLRIHRRPKPPRLKEQALQALAEADLGSTEADWSQRYDTIRRALEQLPD